MATGSSDALTPPSDPEPGGTAHAAGHGKWPSKHISLERRRWTLALALSLLLHTLLLTLTFGGYGFGIPGFGFPWQDRRIEAPDLRVVLVPAEITAVEPEVSPIAQPSRQASVTHPVTGGLVVMPPVSPAPTPGQTAAAIVPKSNSSAKPGPNTATATRAAPAKAPLRTERPGDTSPPSTPEPPVIALAPSAYPTRAVPATPS